MNGIWRVAVRLFRAPFTRRAWRDVRFCATGAITGLSGFAVVAAMLVPALALSASIAGAVIGLPLAAAAISVARWFGAAHRREMRRATGELVTAPAPPRPGPGALSGLGRRLRDSGGWRTVGYAGVKLPVAVAGGYAVAATVIGLADCGYPLAWVLFGNRPVGSRLKPLKALAPIYHGQHWVIHSWQGSLIAALVGAGCVLAGVWLARGITMIDAWLVRSLLGPGRVSELERTRAIAVEDAVAMLQRVERDLHDGAQVRLAAVALNLGLAQEKADGDPLRELLEAAQTQVSGALADLRRIARGIHPPVLDSGLADALTSLAAASPIPAQVSADLPERPAQAIEAIAYFCAAELLANAIKHSWANKIEIIVAAHRKELLQVRVTDDGRGGAALSGGSGLQGLAQRASTVDGTLRVVSPPGGPTTVTVELPMRIRGAGT
jgi:signal transduction histidine kinase